MKNPLYNLSGVDFAYDHSGGRFALKSVDLGIYPREFLALIGPIGSGKTTLLKLLLGLLKPTSGEVLFEGSPLPRKGNRLRKVRRRVGMVFQFAENQIFEATVLEEVLFGLKNFEFPRDQLEILARQGMEMVGLEAEKFADKSPFELSAGEKKRLALASVLALKPEMLLLDEPAAGLDSSGRKALLEILRKHGETGGLVLVTHDLDLALELCSRVVILFRGEKAYDGGREIFYDFDFLQKCALSPPDFTLAWTELTKAGMTNREMVFDLSSAEKSIKRK